MQILYLRFNVSPYTFQINLWRAIENNKFSQATLAKEAVESALWLQHNTFIFEQVLAATISTISHNKKCHFRQFSFGKSVYASFIKFRIDLRHLQPSLFREHEHIQRIDHYRDCLLLQNQRTHDRKGFRRIAVCSTTNRLQGLQTNYLPPSKASKKPMTSCEKFPRRR